MPSDHHHVRACPRQNAHDIHHRDLANWRGCGERVTLHFDGSGPKLCRNILSGPLNGGRSRWTRTYCHELLQILEGSRSVEALRRPSGVGPRAMVDGDKRHDYGCCREYNRKLPHSTLLVNTATTAS